MKKIFNMFKFLIRVIHNSYWELKIIKEVEKFCDKSDYFTYIKKSNGDKI